MLAAADHFVGHHALLTCDFIHPAPHEALDGVHGVLWIGDLLMLRRLADEALALVGERDHRWGGAVALRVDEDLRLAAFHDGDARVGRPEVNADDDACDLASSCRHLLVPSRAPRLRYELGLHAADSDIQCSLRSNEVAAESNDRANHEGQFDAPITARACERSGAVCHIGIEERR